MTTCDRFRGEMLEHLYDLLEPAESQALTDHVAVCNACRTALTYAQSQKAQLAEAARSKFSRIRFLPPTPREVLPGIFTATKQRSPSWQRWVVAAVFLFTVTGLGLPAGMVWHANSQVANFRDRLTQVESEKKELNAPRHFDNSPSEKTKASLVVSGSRVLEPGSSHEFLVETKPTPATTLPDQVTACLTDQDQKLIFQETNTSTSGEVRFNLPSQLPLKPSSLLSLEISARRDGFSQKKITEKIRVSGPFYQTQLATDKKVYCAGETVRFRTVTLDSFSLRPPDRDLDLVFTLTDPIGKEIFQARQRPLQSPLAGPNSQFFRALTVGEFLLPAAAANGPYNLTVHESAHQFLPQSRKLLVRSSDRLPWKTEVEFSRKFYRPGDNVVLQAKVVGHDEKPVSGQKVLATLEINNGSPGAKKEVVPRNKASDTNSDGVATFQFLLPAHLDKEPALRLDFLGKLQNETVTRTVPVILNRLNVHFYPEGGSLVAGFLNRVYFRVRDNLGQPREFEGRVVDDKGENIARAQTYVAPDQPPFSRGIGMFTFVPVMGRRYTLTEESPSNGGKIHPLPAVLDQGVTLTVVDEDNKGDNPIHIRLDRTFPRKTFFVGVSCRGRLLTHQRIVSSDVSKAEVNLKPEENPGGIYGITVFEEQATSAGSRLIPVAKRLIYRQPRHHLDLIVQCDKVEYHPGDRVNLNFRASDETGRSIPALLTVAVADQRGGTPDLMLPRLPAVFLGTSEIADPDDLELADFSVSNKPSGAMAIDLFLGAHGWRRLVKQDSPHLNPSIRGQADQFLVKTIEGVDNEFFSRQESFSDTHDILLAGESLAKDRTETTNAEQRRAVLLSETHALETQILRGLNDRDRWQNLFRYSLGFLAGAICLLLIVLMGKRWASTPAGSHPSFVGFLGTTAVGLLLVVVAYALFGPRRGVLPSVNDELARKSVPASAVVEVETVTRATTDSKKALSTFRQPSEKSSQPAADEKLDRVQDKLTRRESAGKVETRHAAVRPQSPSLLKEPAAAPERPGEKAKGAGTEFPMKDQKNPNRERGLQDRQDGNSKLKAAAASPRGRAVLPSNAAVDPSLSPSSVGGMRTDETVIRMAPVLSSLKEKASVVSKEYAYFRVRGERTKAMETLYWNPALFLTDGQGTVSFDLADSPAAYQIHAWGLTADGQLAELISNLEVKPVPSGKK